MQYTHKFTVGSGYVRYVISAQAARIIVAAYRVEFHRTGRFVGRWIFNRCHVAQLCCEGL